MTVDLAVGEVVVGWRVLGHAEHGRVEHDVRAGALVDQRLCGGGGFDVDHRREEVDVDEHRFSGVDALCRGLGDDCDDGLADVAHLVAGEQRAGDHRVER